MNHKKFFSVQPNDFLQLFTTEEKCIQWLTELKWESGFICKKCGHNHYCEGNHPGSRRCTKCKTEESAASGTIFHNCKFPVSKAFYIAYHVCKKKEEISTYEYARRLSLRQMTCWNFRTKIRNALEKMNSLSEKEKLSIKKILMS